MRDATLTLPVCSEPFCAGVLLTVDGRMVLAIGDEDRWASHDGIPMIPITGIGGGQQRGEGPRDCARREALEEVGSEVTLRGAPITYCEPSLGVVTRQTFDKGDSPLLLQRRLRDDPRPWAPGLPVGAVLTVAMYRATCTRAPEPCDVPALIEVPLSMLSRLRGPVAVESLEALGVILRCRTAIPRHAVLHIPVPSAEDMLLRVVERHGLRVLDACTRR